MAGDGGIARASYWHASCGSHRHAIACAVDGCWPRRPGRGLRLGVARSRRRWQDLRAARKRLPGGGVRRERVHARRTESMSGGRARILVRGLQLLRQRRDASHRSRTAVLQPRVRQEGCNQLLLRGLPPGWPIRLRGGRWWFAGRTLLYFTNRDDQLRLPVGLGSCSGALGDRLPHPSAIKESMSVLSDTPSAVASCETASCSDLGNRKRSCPELVLVDDSYDLKHLVDLRRRATPRRIMALSIVERVGARKTRRTRRTVPAC